MTLRPEDQIVPIPQTVLLREKVREQLEELIIYGTLPLGHRLVEARLAEQLGVSRIPVREALQDLSRDGWVDRLPRQGAVVHRPTRKEVDDVFAVRTLVEVQAARLAAENPTEESIHALRQVLEEGQGMIGTKSGRAILRANERFHAGVTRVAGNRVLTDIVGLINKRVRWYFASVATRRSERSWVEHRDIVGAIADRDPERAAELMRGHVDRTRTAYHAYLDAAPSSVDTVS